MSWNRTTQSGKAAYARHWRSINGERVNAVRRAKCAAYRVAHPFKTEDEIKAAKAAWLKADRLAHPEKYKDKTRQYRLDNPDQLRAKGQIYYLGNREEIRAKAKVVREANLDAHRATNRAYQKSNLAQGVARTAAYRASKLQRTPSWVNLKKIERVYMLCNWVSDFTGKAFHVDHIAPLRGKYISGLHVAENLQILPARENQSKANSW